MCGAVADPRPGQFWFKRKFSYWQRASLCSKIFAVLRNKYTTNMLKDLCWAISIQVHPYPSAVSLQYICSVSAVSTSCALDRPAVHKGSAVKYVLKCSEVHSCTGIALQTDMGSDDFRHCGVYMDPAQLRLSTLSIGQVIVWGQIAHFLCTGCQGNTIQ